MATTIFKMKGRGHYFADMSILVAWNLYIVHTFSASSQNLLRHSNICFVQILKGISKFIMIKQRLMRCKQPPYVYIFDPPIFFFRFDLFLCEIVLRVEFANIKEEHVFYLAWWKFGLRKTYWRFFFWMWGCKNQGDSYNFASAVYRWQ